jgi:hypothetical protein
MEKYIQTTKYSIARHKLFFYKNKSLCVFLERRRFGKTYLSKIQRVVLVVTIEWLSELYGLSVAE